MHRAAPQIALHSSACAHLAAARSRNVSRRAGSAPRAAASMWRCTSRTAPRASRRGSKQRSDANHPAGAAGSALPWPAAPNHPSPARGAPRVVTRPAAPLAPWHQPPARQQARRAATGRAAGGREAGENRRRRGARRRGQRPAGRPPPPRGGGRSRPRGSASSPRCGCHRPPPAGPLSRARRRGGILAGSPASGRPPREPTAGSVQRSCVQRPGSGTARSMGVGGPGTTHRRGRNVSTVPRARSGGPRACQGLPGAGASGLGTRRGQGAAAPRGGGRHGWCRGGRRGSRREPSRRGGGNRSPATAATYSTPPAPGPLCAARRSISRYASSLQRARATRVTPRRGLAAGRRGAGRRARGVRWEVCVEGAAQRGFEVAASGGARRDGEAQGGAVAVGHLKRRARGLALARPPLAAGGRRPAAGPDVEVARALAPVSPAAGAERRRALARGPGGSALSSAQVRHGSAGRGESPHRPCSGRQAALRAGLAQPRPPAHRFGACVSMSREGVPRALGAGPGHAAG